VKTNRHHYRHLGAVVSNARCYFLLLALLLCPAGYGKQKPLKPVPTAHQKLLFHKDVGVTSVVEVREGVLVDAGCIRESKDFFKCAITLLNDTGQPVPVVQEQFFLLNAYGRELYRYSDWEVRLGWLRQMNKPLPAPPPPRKYYRLVPEGSGRYTIMDLGSGYYSVRGYSPSYRVEEYTNEYEAVGQLIVLVIQRLLQSKRVKQAREEIEILDQYYFRNHRLAPKERSENFLFFGAIGNSPKTPIRLICFIAGQEFQFEFTE